MFNLCTDRRFVVRQNVKLRVCDDGRTSPLDTDSTVLMSYLRGSVPAGGGRLIHQETVHAKAKPGGISASVPRVSEKNWITRCEWLSARSEHMMMWKLMSRQRENWEI